MIQIDLSLAHRRSGLSTLQFALLFLGLFLGISVIVGICLVLQWNGLNNLASEITDLETRRDSLELIRAQIDEYKGLQGRHNELLLAIEEAGQSASLRFEILSLMREKLEPGMKLLSYRIEGDSVVAQALSPSNVKVARYIEALSRSGLFGTLKSEPQGTKQGLIEHRIILRIR